MKINRKKTDKNLTVLLLARDYVKAGWCQGAYAQYKDCNIKDTIALGELAPAILDQMAMDSSKVKVCMAGAMYLAVYDRSERQFNLRNLEHTLPYFYRSTDMDDLVMRNDQKTFTKEKAISEFTLAIEVIGGGEVQ